MHAIDDQVETIHLFVVREEPKRPFSFLPLLAALLCVSLIIGMTMYSALHPTYKHATLTVPATALPPRIFQASQPIIPTGITTYPATYAHGILTFTNGSIIAASVPQDFTVGNVITDRAVYVPVGSADGFGKATVPAHLLTAGSNLPALAINEVIGSSLYIRNLSPFTGGHPAYSVQFVTSHDKKAALIQARHAVAAQVNGLHYPCNESSIANGHIAVVVWHCLFVSYSVPPFMHVTGIRLAGRNVIVSVLYIEQPMHVWVR